MLYTVHPVWNGNLIVDGLFDDDCDAMAKLRDNCVVLSCKIQRNFIPI